MHLPQLVLWCSEISGKSRCGASAVVKGCCNEEVMVCHPGAVPDVHSLLTYELSAWCQLFGMLLASDAWTATINAHKMVPVLMRECYNAACCCC